jgi:hypothetical protein
VFVPLANLSTSTLSREEMGNATGLFNMLRNIGGSIGIAMATTALIRRAAQHQNDLAGQLSPANPILQQKAAQIGGYLAHRLGPNAARPGSFGLLYGLMEQQAALKPTSTSFAGPRFSPSSAPPPSGCSRSPSSTPLPRPACIDSTARLRGGHSLRLPSQGLPRKLEPLGRDPAWSFVINF